MTIIGVQLIVAFFAILMLYNLFLHWKKNDIGIKGFIAWFILWGGLLFINFFPKVVEPFIKELFFVRIFDFTTVIAFAVITYIMFENHIRINQMQKQLEDLVRTKAIKSIKK